MLMHKSDEFVHKYDRSSLRTLFSAGEPIGEAAWYGLGILGERRAFQLIYGDLMRHHGFDLVACTS